MAVSGRDREASRILKANKAVAIVQLMRGGFNDWIEFLKPRTDDLHALPRRNLKSGYTDVKKRLSKELDSFCKKNFKNMTETTLASLYDEINVPMGFEMPLETFEGKFAKVLPRVLRGAPKHATVVISLWGLQFEFPEDNITKDILESFRLAQSSEKELLKFKTISHREAADKKEVIGELYRRSRFASRSTILSCFNLLEAYLNGLAWEFTLDDTKFKELSNTKQRLLTDTGSISLRDKIIKYPEVIRGKSLWDDSHSLISNFLNVIKPFRDSIVHPSPFAAPERFGGYNKLQKIYDVDTEIAHDAIKTTIGIIEMINAHLADSNRPIIWLEDIKAEIEEQ